MKSDSISEIIRLASIISVALPTVMYLLKIRQATRPVHLIGALSITSAISDITAYFLFAKAQSTVLLFNTYSVLVFFLLAWFFYEILSVRSGRTTVFAGIGIYIFAFVLITLFVQPFSEYQTFLWTVIGMIMIVYSMSYFFNLFSTQTIMSNYGLLWMNSGILFYFSFNLFLFLMSSYVLTKLEPEISLLIWSFHNVNNILKNILLGFGVALYSKEVREDHRAASEELITVFNPLAKQAVK
jgi:hypothetical protein